MDKMENFANQQTIQTANTQTEQTIKLSSVQTGELAN